MKHLADPGETAPAPEALIERIYAAVLEPGRYDELMGLWQDHLEGVLTRSAAAGPSSTPSQRTSELESHFLRAFTILDRLGRVEDDTRSIEALVEVNPKSSMLVDPGGRIVAANSAAQTTFGIRVGDRLIDLNLDVSGLSAIRAALAELHQHPPARLLAIARAATRTGNDTQVLALTRAQRPDGSPPIAVITVADLTWSMRIGELLRRTFGLTEAECDIARCLVQGDTPRQIAEGRDRALHTVRTQTKSVLRKMEVRSQGELIRLAAALVQMDLVGGGRDTGIPAGTSRTLMRPGGRRLDYAIIGPANGRAVVFIHGMLDGHGVTRFCEEQLHARGIRFIAPVRPHFGTSDPDVEGNADTAADRFASDIEALMDAEGVQCCPIIGHMAGAIYAFAAAYKLGSRVTSIINVSGGVPILSQQQFAVMTPRQRIVAYTARYTPNLLPLILRAGIALLDNGGDRAFMRALYETAPIDHSIARRAEVFAILAQGYHFTVRQGHGAFEIDSRQVTRDWSALAYGSPHQVTLVHGRHDPVVRIGTVRDFASALGSRAEMYEVEELGQLLFYARPDIVLDVLELHLAISKPR